MSVTLSGFSVTAPASGPTVAVAAASGLLGTSAVYGYKVTFLTTFGETTPSAASAVTTNSTGSVAISAIPVSTNGNVTGRNVYRTVAGGAVYKFLATIANNSATTLADGAADGSLGSNAPTVNTAHSVQSVAGVFKQTTPTIATVERAIVAGAGGTSAAAYQLTAEYNLVATVTTTNDSVKLPGSHTVLLGSHVVIRNNGVNTVRIYPFDGQTINSGSVDAPVTLAAGASTQFVMDLATNWSQL